MIQEMRTLNNIEPQIYEYNDNYNEIKKDNKKQLEKEKKYIEQHKEREKQKTKKKVKSQKIIGEKKYIDPTTGEVVVCEVIEKNVNQDFNFFKVWLMDLMNILEVVGTKKMKVVNYILDNLNTQENLFIGTHAEISKELKVSRVVVSQTFKLLIESGLLKKRSNGVYMINPEIIVKGKSDKRLNLLIQYNKIEDKK